MLKIVVSSFLLVFFIFAPALQIKAQFTVGVAANWSPTEILQVQNSTHSLIEQTKQSFGQIQEIALGEEDIQVKVVEFAKTAARWAETVQQYTQQIFQMARQFTSLKGILGLTMQKLGLDSQILQQFKEWATALYAVIALKNQYEALWTSRVTLFKNWWTRAKNGIFNPQQDWLDLQEYFLNGLGRRGYEYQLDIERMRQLDQEFQIWKQQLEKLRQHEAMLQKQITETEQNLFQQTTKAGVLSPVDVNDNSGSGTINMQSTVSSDRIAQDELMLTTLKKDLLDVQKEIQILLDKMNDRYTWYYLVYGKAIEDGDAVLEGNQGWETLYGIKFGDLGKLIDFNSSPGFPEPTPTP